jgi:hypothetical protein
MASLSALLYFSCSSTTAVQQQQYSSGQWLQE